MMQSNPVLLGFLASGAPAVPAAPWTLSISPVAIPAFTGAGPYTQAFVVTATGGQTEVKWQVFNQDWTAVGPWQTAAVSGTTANFTATFTASGQRVQVKSVDETIEATTDQVTIAADAPPKPTANPSQALDISPSEPGTIQPVNGIAVWRTWVGSNAYGSVLWVVVNPGTHPSPWSFVGNYRTAPLVGGWAMIEAEFTLAGQFVKIANPANPAEQRDSGAVSLSGGASTPGVRPAPTAALQMDPVNPGTIQPVNGIAEWDVFIGSNVHASLLWQVFEGSYANFAARGPYQTVPLTGGWARIFPQFTRTGQFLKIVNPSNTGVWLDSGAVTVPEATPTQPLPSNPTETPIPVGTTVARLDILFRGQSNAYFAHYAGGAQVIRDIIANLTQIPTVNLVSRVNTGQQDNTIHSGSWSYYNGNAEPKWLLGVVGQNPGLWENSGPMNETLAAVSGFVSSDPNHALLDYRLHLEFDMAMWEQEWNALYRIGTWEVTKRIRDRAAKAATRTLTAYAECSYQGKDLGGLDPLLSGWAQDLADGTLRVVKAAGSQIDGEVRTEFGEDYSHNSDAALFRQCVRAGVYLARRCWDIGWCPAGVDLSWLPSGGPRIASGSRSGSSVFLSIQHDKGTALAAPAAAAGVRWADFWIPQLGGHGFKGTDNNGTATGGTFTDATTLRVDFRGPVPSGAQLWHGYWPRMTLGDGRNVIRDNWHAIRPAASNTIPSIGTFESLLRRTLTPITLA